MRRWLVSGGAYVASVVAELVILRAIDAQPARLIAGLTALLIGPAIAALLVGRPPLLLLVVLLPIYFGVVALFSSGYDESRWSYSRAWPAAFSLVFQLIGVALVVQMRRPVVGESSNSRR